MEPRISRRDRDGRSESRPPFADLLPRAEGLFIVPPFSRVEVAVSGVHILQAVARARGHRVGVLYANLLFARQLGIDSYEELCGARPLSLLGERLFAGAAFGTPVAGPDIEELLDDLRAWGMKLDLADLQRLSTTAAAFAHEIGTAIASAGYRFVGATTCFQQNCSSLAILSAVKSASPDIVTLLGGSNCDGEMAEGLRSLPSAPDFVFSGEAEETFARFLDGLSAGRLPTSPILEGSPCERMDEVPLPDYSDYFDQVRQVLPEVAVENTYMIYETCRGCWKGAKSRCTFCGLRGTRVECDEKSADRVLADLRTLIDRSPTRHVVVADNIMPLKYHATLVPRLRAELPPVDLVWYQRSNLTLEQMKGLCDAGIRHVRAGVESLSTPVLKRMRKSVLTRQNLALLRYARSLRMGLAWNLLYGFPGDGGADYRAMIDLIRLIPHLSPPSGVTELEIDRFSPYFDAPGEFGLTNLAPLRAYRGIYPWGADIERLAYTFEADYRSESRDDPDLLAELRRAVDEWRRAWLLNAARPPLMRIRPDSGARFVLEDRRGLPGRPERMELDAEQAQLLLAGAPLGRSPLAAWAIDRELAVGCDGWCVPLATSDYETLRAAERRGPSTWLQRAPGTVPAGLVQQLSPVSTRDARTTGHGV